MGKSGVKYKLVICITIIFFAFCAIVSTVYLSMRNDGLVGIGLSNFNRAVDREYDEFLEKGSENAINLYQTVPLTGQTSKPSSYESVSEEEIMGEEMIAKFGVKISSSAGGTILPTSGINLYEYGSVVTISAISKEGYDFVGWIENGISISTNPHYTFTVLTDRDIQASFEKKEYVLKLSSSEGGYVSRPKEGEHVYHHGNVISLIAHTEEERYFSHWGGDVENVDDIYSPETTVLIEGNYSLQANFVPEQYTLSIGSRNGGDVEILGEGIVEGGEENSFVYDAGTEVILIVREDENYSFTGWSGGPLDKIRKKEFETNMFVATMESDISIFAEFSVKRSGMAVTYSLYDLSLSSSVGGSVSVPGEGTFSYNENDIINIEATSLGDYAFSHWSGDVTNVDDVNSANTSVQVQGNYNIVANFVMEVHGSGSVLNSAERIYFNEHDSNVAIDPYSGNVMNYAWSDEVGWIDFDDVSVEKSDGKLSGTATVLNTGESIFFDGDTNSEVEINLANGTISGYAWSDDIGWIHFDLAEVPEIETKTLTYSIIIGGYIDGEAEQIVDFWGDGAPVTAEANTGYYFVEWDDGESNSSRTETEVIEDLTFVGVFEVVATVEIVDSEGEIIANPSLDFGEVDFAFSPKKVTTILGTNDDKVRISKNNFSGGFNVYLSLTGDYWSDGGTNTIPYDSEIPGQGLLEVDFSDAIISPVESCSLDGLSEGVSTNFFESSNITLMTGDTNSSPNCQWDLGGVSLEQTMPAKVVPGEYILEMVLTIL
jgi:hypothetical protein